MFSTRFVLHGFASSVSSQINNSPYLRLSFEGSNNSTIFTDSSSNNFPVVRSSDAIISTTKSKIGNSSLYTTNGGAQITAPTAFFATDDWTVEMWVWADSMSGVQTLFGTMALGGGGLHIHITGGSLSINNGISGAIGYSCDLTTQWNHISVVRRDGIITLWLNGVDVATTDQTPGIGRGVITVGPDPNVYNGYYYSGYIDEVRVTTSATTTPATILLHFDGDFDDSSVNNFTVTQQNGATTSSDQSKFGGESLLSDPGWASIAADPITDLGSSDWTIELWYYQTGGGYSLAGQWGSGGNSWFIGNNSFYDSTTNSISWDAPTSDTWHHVAIVRKLNTIKAFIDGTMVNSTNFIGSFTSSTSYIGIGRDQAGNATLVGYIDDFRMTKDLAVYDGDFIPPTTALSANVSRYAPYKLYGTLLFSECVDGDLVGTYADGNGGRYTETISVGSC